MTTDVEKQARVVKMASWSYNTRGKMKKTCEKCHEDFEVPKCANAKKLCDTCKKE